jgi:hypothetical protein
MIAFLYLDLCFIRLCMDIPYTWYQSTSLKTHHEKTTMKTWACNLETPLTKKKVTYIPSTTKNNPEKKMFIYIYILNFFYYYLLS